MTRAPHGAWLMEVGIKVTNHHKCMHCNKPIILVPSAEERAKKYGGTPESYRKLFSAHTECTLEYRNKNRDYLLIDQFKG